MTDGTSIKSKGTMISGAVTLLDILGWKGIWTRDDAAISKLQSLISEIKTQGDIIISSLARTDNKLRGAVVRTESISDTIALFTNTEEASIGLKIHGEICKIAVCRSIQNLIPLRGATCFGQYLVADEGSIMIGPAIDEAASWHENADWIGVIQTPSAYLLDSQDTSDPWVLYKSAPIKSGRFSDSRCVNWCATWLTQYNNDKELAIRELKTHFVRMGPLVPEIAGKYVNTLNFYLHCSNLPAPS